MIFIKNVYEKIQDKVLKITMGFFHKKLNIQVCNSYKKIFVKFAKNMSLCDCILFFQL